MDSKKDSIFKKGSKTYYNASKFFPKHIRDEVTTLYAFVRTVDDYVDAVPQQEEEFYKIKKELVTRQQGKASGNDLVDDFVSLAEEREFKKEWIKAFMDSMEFDLTGKNCTTTPQVKKYIYGSADVIGLMMAKIMQLPNKALPYAQKLGESMQMINFIRDVDEDLEMKRWYLPLDIKPTLKERSREYITTHPQEFKNFLQQHITNYYKENKQAEKGFKYIPRSVRIPVMTASKMYEWTAKQIEKDPMIIFERKVKPQKWKIVLTYVQISIQQAFK